MDPAAHGVTPLASNGLNGIPPNGVSWSGLCVTHGFCLSAKQSRTPRETHGRVHRECRHRLRGPVAVRPSVGEPLDPTPRAWRMPRPITGPGWPPMTRPSPSIRAGRGSGSACSVSGLLARCGGVVERSYHTAASAETLTTVLETARLAKAREATLVCALQRVHGFLEDTVRAWLECGALTPGACDGALTEHGMFAALEAEAEALEAVAPEVDA